MVSDKWQNQHYRKQTRRTLLNGRLELNNRRLWVWEQNKVTSILKRDWADERVCAGMAICAGNYNVAVYSALLTQFTASARRRSTNGKWKIGLAFSAGLARERGAEKLARMRIYRRRGRPHPSALVARCIAVPVVIVAARLAVSVADSKATHTHKTPVGEIATNAVGTALLVQSLHSIFPSS